LLLETGGDIATRRARLAAAEAGIAAAAPREPATLRAEIENIPNGVEVDRSQQVIVGLEAMLLRGPAPGALRSQAEAARDLTAFGLALAEQRAVATLRRGAAAFTAAALIDNRLGQTDALLANAEEALRSRFEVGGARYVDVLRIRTARVNLMVERSSRQADATERLEAVVGLFGSDSARSAARSNAGRLDAATTLETLAAVPVARDSLLGAQWQAFVASRAEAGIRTARARRGTTLNGFLGVQRFQDIDGTLVVGPTVGLTMPLAFTAGGSTNALVAAAEAQRSASLAEASARRVTHDAQVRQALVRFDAARARLAAVDAALLAGARAERDAALAAFQSGELSLVELLDFERALALADVARIDALRDAADAAATMDQLPADQFLDLADALGGL
jgi:outer membrane protein TolC